MSIVLSIYGESPEQEVEEFRRLINGGSGQRSIYDDVAELQEKVAAIEPKVADSGWVTIPLADGVQAYNTVSAPQARRIGDIVFIRGAVKNVLANAKVIGTLPEELRPTKSTPFVQNTSHTAAVTTNVARWVIGTDGQIIVESISEGASYGATKWFPINAAFEI